MRVFLYSDKSMQTGSTSTKKYLLFGLGVLLSIASYAQLPVCSPNDQRIYFMGYEDPSTTLYTYNPQLPISASNPTTNTIMLPGGGIIPQGSGGLAVGPNLFGTTPAYTFYTTLVTGAAAVSHTYYYYDGSQWVNTNHRLTNSSAVNIGMGGRYIYNLDGLTGSVYRYDGTGQDQLIVTISDFQAGGPFDVHGDDQGNFYILRTDTPNQYLRKYCPAGVLLKEWKLINAPPARSGGGFSMIDDKIYYINTDILYQGTIGTSTVSIVQHDPLSLPYGATDFSACQIPDVPGFIKASIDTAYYCGTGPGIPISALGYGNYVWSVLSGTATITGSGTAVTVTATTTSKILLTSTCLTKSDTVTIIVPKATVDAGPNTTTSSCASNRDTLNATLTGTTAGLSYSLNWSPSANIISGAHSLQLIVDPPSNRYYTLTVSTAAAQGGCTFKDSAQVILKARPNPPSIPTKQFTYCKNTVASQLQATGTSLRWYNGPADLVGTAVAPTPTTTNTGVFPYYVAQTIGNCESQKDSILVTVFQPTAPTVISPVAYCPGDAASPLTATGTNLQWYDALGTTLASAPTPSTASPDTVVYQVTQSSSGCESPKASISVEVAAAVPPPLVTSPIKYCQNSTAAALTAIGTNLHWYTSSSGAGSTTAPVPPTTAVDTLTYYVDQTKTCGQSAKASLEVIIVPQPAKASVSNLSYCQFAVALPLQATGQQLTWYTDSLSTLGSSSAPTPPTDSVKTRTYFVTQKVNGCESVKQRLSVLIKALPTDPGFVSPKIICQRAATNPLSATGDSIWWYSSAAKTDPSMTAPIPSSAALDTTTYYLNRIKGGCESPVKAWTVQVKALDTVDFQYNNLLNCKNGANPIVLPADRTGGGTFIASPSTLKFVSTATGEVNLSKTPVGKYAISYRTTTTQCPNISSPTTLEVLAIPNTAFHYAKSSFCHIDSLIKVIPNTAPGFVGDFWTKPLSGTSDLLLEDAALGTVRLSKSLPGVYRIYNGFTDENSCSSIDSTTLTIQPIPAADFKIPAQVCNTAVLPIVFLSARPTALDTRYQWTFEGANPVSSTDSLPNNITWSSTIRGAKKISLQVAANGCHSPIVQKSIQVIQAPVPEIQTSLDSNLTVYLENKLPVVCTAVVVDSSGIKTSYNWWIEKNSTRVFAAQEAQIRYSCVDTGWYIIYCEAENLKGCKDTTLLRIQAKETAFIRVPSGFNPTRGVTLKPISPLEMTGFDIYNRWGERIFSTNKPEIGWDGTHQQQLVPAGAYVYVVYARSLTGNYFSQSGMVAVLY